MNKLAIYGDDMTKALVNGVLKYWAEKGINFIYRGVGSIFRDKMKNGFNRQHMREVVETVEEYTRDWSRVDHKGGRLFRKAFETVIVVADDDDVYLQLLYRMIGGFQRLETDYLDLGNDVSEHIKKINEDKYKHVKT